MKVVVSKRTKTKRTKTIKKHENLKAAEVSI